MENIDRDGYHHTTDTTAKIDWEYATAIGKIAIETAVELADGSRRQAVAANTAPIIRIGAFAGGALVLAILVGYALHKRSRIRAGV